LARVRPMTTRADGGHERPGSTAQLTRLQRSSETHYRPTITQQARGGAVVGALGAPADAPPRAPTGRDWRHHYSRFRPLVSCRRALRLRPWWPPQPAAAPSRQCVGRCDFRLRPPDAARGLAGSCCRIAKRQTRDAASAGEHALHGTDERRLRSLLAYWRARGRQKGRHTHSTHATTGTAPSRVFFTRRTGAGTASHPRVRGHFWRACGQSAHHTRGARGPPVAASGLTASAPLGRAAALPNLAAPRARPWVSAFCAPIVITNAQQHIDRSGSS
jgi:hypothetical protein